MPIYTVQAERLIHAEFQVEADSEDLARQDALELAHDVLNMSYDVDDEVRLYEDSRRPYMEMWSGGEQGDWQ